MTIAVGLFLKRSGCFLEGKRYGRLTLLAVYKKNNYKMAHCSCICGRKTEVYYANLIAGRTKSCGCLERENRHKRKELVNQKFGDLTVCCATNERKCGSVVWLCQCVCGNFVKKDAHSLLRGRAKDCGCHKKKLQLTAPANSGQLRVIRPLDEKMNWKTQWLCQCSCGRQCHVSYANLYFGHTRSCGCLKEKEYRTLIEGTIAESLQSKVPKNNTSGVKGVYHYRGKWRAYITFKRKRHYLGTFETIQEAAEARKNGEKKYYEPLLRKVKARSFLPTDRFC